MISLFLLAHTKKKVVSQHIVFFLNPIYFQQMTSYQYVYFNIIYCFKFLYLEYKYIQQVQICTISTSLNLQVYNRGTQIKQIIQQVDVYTILYYTISTHLYHKYIFIPVIPDIIKVGKGHLKVHGRQRVSSGPRLESDNYRSKVGKGIAATLPLF